MDGAKRVMSGTHGELWIDGELVAEVYKFQAKVDLKREPVPQCGKMWEDQKLMGYAGNGSLGIHKVNSRMAIIVGEKIRKGIDPRFTLISKLADPDAYGAERVVIKEVGFNDVTLADWEAGQKGTVECPFIFTDYEYIDKVEVQ